MRPPGRIRAATWNLWWRFGGDWIRRHDAIVETLRRHEPDVVGLQEVWSADGTDQATVLAEELGMHSAFAGPSLPPTPDPPEEPTQEGVGLGVGLLSRWPIASSHCRVLPSPSRGLPPVALIAVIAHPLGPLHIVVSCTEWESAYAADHLRQTQELATILADAALDGPLPVLLTADLNAAPGSEELRPLEAIAADTWTLGRGDPDAVTLSSEHPRAPLEAVNQLDRRIDHILARPGGAGQAVTVSEVKLIGDPVNGTYPSDHYGVVAEIESAHTGPAHAV